ncbi:MAG: glucose-1-phosphate adenylyltransferase, partial [bacterium]
MLSNIQQTGKITDTFVMQQYEPASLQQHIGYGREWSFNSYERRVHILWPQQTQEKDEIEQWPGTVSPIRQYRDRIFDR